MRHSAGFVLGLATFLCIGLQAIRAAQDLTKVLEFGGPNQAQTGLVQGPDGTLYAWDRGSDTNRTGRLVSLGKGGSGVTLLHAFTGTADDGDTPFCLVFASDGMLYGVAADYQAKTRGRVFALTPIGGGYRVLRRWDAAANEHGTPFGLIEGSDQVLYGVAQPGGTLGSDTIWKLNKDGSGYAVLHDFEAGIASPDTTLGPSLGGNLIEGRDSKLYGVVGGNTGNSGVVYRLNRDGSNFEPVHEFTGNGQGGGPFGRLLHGRDGFLYGVGNNGGEGNKGVIYRLHLDGTGFQVLSSGTVASFDPNNQLSESADGYLYGTASNAGSFAAGLIYRLRLDGSGLEILHEFNLLAQPPLGIQPTTTLHATDGYLYFGTRQQISSASFEWRPFLLRFGPVPLPPPDSAPVKIKSSVTSVGPNRLFGLSFTGTPGHLYEIQATDQLPPVWQSAQKLTADGTGKVAFQEDSIAGRNTRFFRVAE